MKCVECNENDIEIDSALDMCNDCLNEFTNMFDIVVEMKSYPWNISAKEFKNKNAGGIKNYE